MFLYCKIQNQLDLATAQSALRDRPNRTILRLFICKEIDVNDKSQLQAAAYAHAIHHHYTVTVLDKPYDSNNFLGDVLIFNQNNIEFFFVQ